MSGPKRFPEGKVRGCERCGEADIVVNIEAFEISGEIVCDECADQIFEEEKNDRETGVGQSVL